MHPNIIIIRPDQLLTSRRKKLQEEVEAAGSRAGALFNERPDLTV
ncbi:unnamed protein product, partial [Strongylus vulgaris]